jgi:hypothetical protein
MYTTRGRPIRSGAAHGSQASPRCFDALPAITASDPCFLSVAEAAALIAWAQKRLRLQHYNRARGGTGSEQNARGDCFTACGARSRAR